MEERSPFEFTDNELNVRLPDEAELVLSLDADALIIAIDSDEYAFVSIPRKHVPKFMELLTRITSFKRTVGETRKL